MQPKLKPKAQLNSSPKNQAKSRMKHPKLFLKTTAGLRATTVIFAAKAKQAPPVKGARVKTQIFGNIFLHYDIV